MSRNHDEVNGTTSNKQTPTRVIEILEQLRHSQQRVAIMYGDTDTGRAWGDVELGRIGRSTGRVKVPLIVHNRRSFGGPQLLEHCIVGIRLTTKPHNWLYKHPRYTVPEDDYTPKIMLDI